MKRILLMFEPTTVPVTISGSPPKTEITPTANSGSEVPKATTVAPMMNEGTLN